MPSLEEKKQEIINITRKKIIIGHTISHDIEVKINPNILIPIYKTFKKYWTVYDTVSLIHFNRIIIDYAII